MEFDQYDELTLQQMGLDQASLDKHDELMALVSKIDDAIASERDPAKLKAGLKSIWDWAVNAEQEAPIEMLRDLFLV